MKGRRLNQKVAIVTGAGTGIGQAIAVAFAREGACVVGAGRRSEKLEETAKKVSAEGGEFVPVVADVSIAADVARLVGECLSRFGRVDILVNNAGVLVRGGVLNLSEDDFDRAMAVNVKAAFLCSKAVAPHMIRQGRGCIINNAGGVASRPNANVAYSASKAAMVNMTKGMAAELSPRGVRVNAVSPGPIDTIMTRPSWDDPVRGPILQKRSLLGRIADPAEVASGVVFLASEEAAFITGADLPIDAGWVLA